MLAPPQAVMTHTRPASMSCNEVAAAASISPLVSASHSNASPYRISYSISRHALKPVCKIEALINGSDRPQMRCTSFGGTQTRSGTFISAADGQFKAAAAGIGAVVLEDRNRGGGGGDEALQHRPGRGIFSPRQ